MVGVHYIDINCTVPSARDGCLVEEVGGSSSNCQDKAGGDEGAWPCIIFK